MGEAVVHDLLGFRPRRLPVTRELDAQKEPDAADLRRHDPRVPVPRLVDVVAVEIHDPPTLAIFEPDAFAGG